MHKRNKDTEHQAWISQIKELRQYLIAIFLSLLVSYFFIVNFSPVIVSGQSMEPTLTSGTILLSTRTFTYEDLYVGDIIVFKEKGKGKMIKRIIAKEGDEVWITDGIVYVNGQESPYQFDKIEDFGILTNHTTVGKNKLFCMGDNRNGSYDSRKFGAIDFTKVRCKIVKRLIEKDGSVEL